MSTRSRIAYNYDGHFMSIYCHYDGYLEGVGKVLQDYYPFDEAIDLIMGGDMSSIAYPVENIERYPDNNYLGRPNVVTHDTLDDLLAYFEDSDEEYLYVIDEVEERWKVWEKDYGKESGKDIINFLGYVDELI